MKVLHVDTEKSWRGGEQQLLYLVKGLVARGCVSVVACRKGSPLQERCRVEGIQTLSLTGNQLLDAMRLARSGRKYDLVHAHAANAHTLSIISRYFHGRPVIYTRRVDYVPKNNFLTKRKYGATDAVIAITEAVRRILVEYGVDDEKLRVIYSSVDDHYDEDVENVKVQEIRKRYEGKVIIGSVGALTEQKNHMNFIEAAKNVLRKRKDAVFLIIGDGHLYGVLEEKIRAEVLEGDVLLLGFKRDIQNYLKALDVFVLSSDYEGMGSVILAAMILGIPVVSTDTGGTGEIVLNGKTGLLVPKGDASALADAVLKIMDDAGTRNTFIANARSNVMENFLVTKMVNDYLVLYSEFVR